MTALPRVAPSSAGVDAAGILDLIASQQAPEQELHSLMVLRHGQVLAEGWWDPYAPDVAQLVYSMSKTFTSAAVGLCVADGLFGYDDLVAELFADVVDGELGPHAASMKVRDVLAMAGGHSDAQVEKLQSGPFAGGVAANSRLRERWLERGIRPLRIASRWNSDGASRLTGKQCAGKRSCCEDGGRNHYNYSGWKVQHLCSRWRSDRCACGRKRIR